MVIAQPAKIYRWSHNEKTYKELRTQKRNQKKEFVTSTPSLSSSSVFLSVSFFKNSLSISMASGSIADPSLFRDSTKKKRVISSLSLPHFSLYNHPLCVCVCFFFLINIPPPLLLKLWFFLNHEALHCILFLWVSKGSQIFFIPFFLCCFGNFQFFNFFFDCFCGFCFTLFIGLLRY